MQSAMTTAGMQGKERDAPVAAMVEGDALGEYDAADGCELKQGGERAAPLPGASSEVYCGGAGDAADAEAVATRAPTNMRRCGRCLARPEGAAHARADEDAAAAAAAAREGGRDEQRGHGRADLQAGREERRHPRGGLAVAVRLALLERRTRGRRRWKKDSNWDVPL